MLYVALSNQNSDLQGILFQSICLHFTEKESVLNIYTHVYIKTRGFKQCKLRRKITSDNYTSNSCLTGLSHQCVTVCQLQLWLPSLINLSKWSEKCGWEGCGMGCGKIFVNFDMLWLVGFYGVCMQTKDCTMYHMKHAKWSLKRIRNSTWPHYTNDLNDSAVNKSVLVHRESWIWIHLMRIQDSTSPGHTNDLHCWAVSHLYQHTENLGLNPASPKSISDMCTRAVLSQRGFGTSQFN